MAYRLKHSDSDATSGLQRVASELLDKAKAELSSAGLSDQERVHQLRKRMKMLRGLARLFQPDFPKYKKVNAAARDAARELSELRDADVLIATYDSLCAHYGDEVDRRRYAGFRRVLTWRSKAFWGTGDTPERLAAYGVVIGKLSKRVGSWQVRAKGFKAPLEGAAKTYDRARRAMKAARKNPSAAAMHEWRKRVKYHWYHARLIRPIAPKILRDHAILARDLSEVLGDHNDLSVFDAQLDELSARAASADAAGFRTLIHRRQAELEAEAFRMGKRLLSEKPDRMMKRWRGYWKASKTPNHGRLLQARA